MRFDDEELATLDLRNAAHLGKILSRLCGEPIHLACRSASPCEKCQLCMNWSILSKRLESQRFTLEEFNDVLLLSNQRPMGRAFFDFFFNPTGNTVDFGQMKQGIANFEGYAMLVFGNLRFAYRKLYQLDLASLRSAMGDLAIAPQDLLSKYKRTDTRHLPAAIPPSDTWLLGYIAKGAADYDIATYHAMATLTAFESEDSFIDTLDEDQRKLYAKRKGELLARNEWKNVFAELDQTRIKVERLQQSLLETRTHGWRNTTHYLAADFMDVYVATSMRERWEFEDISRFVNELFRHPELAGLKLRYFDPTQSHLDYRIDKGLVEGLMLKRAACTVYMVQETDTFGKDSELAATLAQGKPVIAYVPHIDPQKLAGVAVDRPLSFIQRRLPQLAAERKIEPSQLPEVFTFLDKVSRFQPFYILSSDEESRFIEENNLQDQKAKICKILADAEAKLFESRAATLQHIHPLSVQVHLDTGVANGVLVVRSIEQCAKLLKALLTNTCEFKIMRSKREGATLLIEKTSQCPFRVLTDNQTLTNSFWSWYLTAT